MNENAPRSESYRDRLYPQYGQMFQDASKHFDEGSAARWAKAYGYYFRGWTPQQRDASIVDLACGGGRLLYFFKQCGFSNILGIDISQDQVAISRQVVSDVVQENVLGFLPENKNQFHLITALDLVEHFRKDEVMQFLDGCYAALRPGGRLILQTPNADSPWGSMHRYNDFTHEVGFNPNALGRLMKSVGLSQIEAREMGPVPWGHSVPATVRALIWKAIRAGLKVWNLAETGHAGSGVLTRVFLISGTKPS